MKYGVLQGDPPSMNEVTYGDPGGDPEGIPGGSDLQNGGSWLNRSENTLEMKGSCESARGSTINE